MQTESMAEMVADYMENGFLENIIDMFRHDRTLYHIVPSLMSDERSRVRIGTVALVENLRDVHKREILEIIPAIATLFNNENPVVRADAAYLLGAIGGEKILMHLKKAAEVERVEPVKQVIEETIEELAGDE